MAGRVTPRAGLGLEPVDETSLADRAHEQIKRAILDGVLVPGDQLTIGSLAKELGIGRTPVREALKALDRDGLVSVERATGTEVRRIPLEELSHRFAARGMLEGLATKLACQARGPELARELEEACVAAQGKAGTSKEEVKELVDLNRRFHGAIYEGCESDLIRSLLDRLQNPRPFSEFLFGSADRRRSSARYHESIAAAVRAGDAELAGSLMQRHIHDATAFALEIHEDYYGHWSAPR